MKNQPVYNNRSMKEYFYKVFNGGENFIWPLVLFFAPIGGVLLTVGAFIILDTIAGIWKSKVKKIPITSKGLSGVISKMFLYQVTVLTTYLLDYFILGDILDRIFSVDQLLTKVVAMVLIYIEAQSINENYKEAKGIDLWQQFKRLLSRTKELSNELKDVSEGVKEVTTEVKEIVSEVQEIKAKVQEIKLDEKDA